MIAHIENMDARHLNMNQEQFETYSNTQNDMDNIGNIQKVIETNLKILSELKDKQKLIKQETFKLQTDIKVFKELIKVKFTNCINSNLDSKKAASSFQNVLDDNEDVLSFNETSKNILQPIQLTNQ